MIVQIKDWRPKIQRMFQQTERLRRIKIQFCNFLENQEIKIHKYIEDNVFVLSCELLNLKNLNDDDDNANLATGHPNLFCND
ncbi:unnamed protein product [Rhizophagus irregularis]|nr:unnamed protein product [Rhizophagus irregularis]